MGFQDNVNVDVRGAAHIAPCTYKTVVLKQNITKQNLNVLTQAMLDEYGANTKFVIKWDYVLKSDITIPANCILEFDGGSVNGAYTITGQNTGIEAGLVKIFGTYITLTGTWNVVEAYPEWFGAKGDGVTDDYIPVQKVLDSGLSSIVFLNKKYKVTNTIMINTIVSIIGCYGNGQSEYLHDIKCGFVSTANIGMRIMNVNSQRFYSMVYKGFGIKGTNTAICGIDICGANNLILEALNVTEYTNGIGISFNTPNTSSLTSQYSVIDKCVIGMCKTGIKVNNANGIRITNCHIDGNNNGSWINNYTHGVPPNSIGIDLNCETASVDNNIIQGFGYGIIVGGSINKLSNIRLEMTIVGIYVKDTAPNNFIGPNINNVNHLLLSKNGLPSSGMFGILGYIASEGNVIYSGMYNSCYGMYVESENNIDYTAYKAEFPLGTIDGNGSTDTIKFNFLLNDRRARTIHKAKFRISNPSDVSSWGVRWTIV